MTSVRPSYHFRSAFAVPSSAPIPLAGDERAHLRQRSGVEYMAWFNPAAAGRAEPKIHLPIQPSRPMTVAVDRQRDAVRRSVAAACGPSRSR